MPRKKGGQTATARTKMAGVEEKALCFYLLSAGINAVGTYYDYAHMSHLPIFQQYGGRFRFLTHLTQHFNLAFTCVAALAAAWATASKHSQRRPYKPAAALSTGVCLRWRDALFRVVSAPLSITVSLLFWGMTLLDPDSLMTPESKLLMPLSGGYNNYLHTFPVVYALAGLVLVRQPPPSVGRALSLMVLVIVMYVGWIERIQHVEGVAVYPFLTPMAFFPPRALFYLFVYAFVSLLYLATVWLWPSGKSDSKID